jgi:hypothetical protein
MEIGPLQSLNFTSNRSMGPSVRDGCAILFVQLGDRQPAPFFRREALSKSWAVARKLMEGKMADEFTFLGVAAGIGLMLLVILLI